MVADSTRTAVTGSPGRTGDGPAAADGAREAVTVTVRYFAAARAAAGVDDEAVLVEQPATVATVIGAAADRHGENLTRVLGRCSYLLGSTAVHDLDAPVRDGDQLDVLPPFAGG